MQMKKLVKILQCLACSNGSEPASVRITITISRERERKNNLTLKGKKKMHLKMSSAEVVCCK